MTAVHQGCVGQQDATSPASQVGMEGEARNETLIERLEAEDWKVECDDGSYDLRQTPHEAAKAIRDLEAENARLRSAPIPAVQSGAVAWGIRNIDTGHIRSRLCTSEVAAKASARAATSNYGSYEPVALYAAPQSEPLPGGVGEALRAARDDFEAIRARLTPDSMDTASAYARAVEAGQRIDAALSGKEQG